MNEREARDVCAGTTGRIYLGLLIYWADLQYEGLNARGDFIFQLAKGLGYHFFFPRLT